MKYSIIKNNQILVALPTEEVLTDLMFEKGWRSYVNEASLRDCAQCGATIWEPSAFYREYLAEDELDPSNNTDRYYEGSLNDWDSKGNPPDVDEEDFDEFFVPDETDSEEEF